MGKEAERNRAAPRSVRPLLWVALGAVVTIAGAEAGLTFFRERAEANAKEIAAAASGRATRAKTAASMALVPLPVKSPLVERPGVDEYGYPRSYVDQAALRSLLGRKKYEELSLHVEEFQAKFESDFHAEYLVRAVTDAFGSPEAELGPELDDCAGLSLRRGGPRRARRGIARDTHSTNFAAMRQEFDRLRPARAVHVAPASDNISQRRLR